MALVASAAHGAAVHNALVRHFRSVSAPRVEVVRDTENPHWALMGTDVEGVLADRPASVIVCQTGGRLVPDPCGEGMELDQGSRSWKVIVEFERHVHFEAYVAAVAAGPISVSSEGGVYSMPQITEYSVDFRPLIDPEKGTQLVFTLR